MSVALPVLFLALGLLWVLFPQWFYKKVSPEQQARDRQRFMTFGGVILLIGLLLLGIQALK